MRAAREERVWTQHSASHNHDVKLVCKPQIAPITAEHQVVAVVLRPRTPERRTHDECRGASSDTSENEPICYHRNACRQRKLQ